MTTIINLTDLTNGSIVNQEWQGTGVFDILMSAVNKNIEVQYNKGRITGSDYAQVYTQSLQATLQQATEFMLRRDLTEAQVDGLIAENSLKQKELEIREQELLIKQQEVLQAAQQLLLLQKELDVKEEQRKATKAEVVIKDKEAAKLGLDNVMKNAEATRITNPTAVYTPKYGV